MSRPVILYVDDEIENLTAFKAVFRRIYDIDTAISAEEGMTKMDQKHYDIVISDQRMPKMTGVQFFEIIQERYPDVIRIVLTGYSDMNAIIDAINKGKVYHYISKPWKAEEMQVILGNALKYHDLRVKNKELEKQNIQSQYEILKSQINPHFLFNSMNVLGLLIKEDKEKAIAFTNNFSKVYRILLQLKNEKVISLEEELDLVNNYLFLQNIRFDESLTIDNQVPEKDIHKYALPPFSIQLSVENAIKHNVVSVKKPLNITLKVLEDQFIIENNYQPRLGSDVSTGTGILNIKSRYKLLNAPEPNFEIIEDFFRVTLPLILEG